LGPSANAITAHFLLNLLQGLAATTSNSNEENAIICDAQTTHYVEQNRWVPRALLVDEPTRFFASSQLSSGTLQGQGGVETLDPSLTLQHAEPSEWNQRLLPAASQLAYSSHSRYLLPSSAPHDPVEHQAQQ
jgi:hypothetical protein